MISLNFINQRLTLTISAQKGTTSITQIFCGSNSRPLEVLINGRKDLNNIWRYDATDNILFIRCVHYSDNTEILVDWNIYPSPQRFNPEFILKALLVVVPLVIIFVIYKHFHKSRYRMD